MSQIDKIKVAVKDNSIVMRDPVSKQRLTTEGKLVPRNAFWLRRIKCGDVVLLNY